MSWFAKKSAKRCKWAGLGHLEAHVLPQKKPPRVRFAMAWKKKWRSVVRCKTAGKSWRSHKKWAELWDRMALTTAPAAAHLKRPNRAIVSLFGGHYFFPGKKTWLLNGGHKRVWVKRWVLKRRNISVTLSPITPPQCGHISSLMLLTIISICTIVMIITAVVIWWSPGSSDHGQSHKSKSKQIKCY